MKSKLLLMLLAAALLAVTISSASANVIYLEEFSGDGSVTVDGLAPTITTDGNTWASQNLQGSTMVTTDGVYTANAGCALLSFEPELNKVYTLSVEMNHLGIKYLGFGFTKNPIRPTAYNTGNRFPNVLGIAWFQYGHEDVVGEGSNIKLWGGPGSYTDGVKNAVIPNTGTYVGGEFVTLMVVIDTTGDGSSFTADFVMDGVSITDGPQTIALAVDDINYCGLDSYGPRSGFSPIGSMVDNFKLYEGAPVLLNASPENGAEVRPGDVDLSWTNIELDPDDPNAPDTLLVDVLFGTEPNVNSDDYDMVKVVDAVEDATFVTVPDRTDGTYYWQVSFEVGEPNMVMSDMLHFVVKSDIAPTVEIDTLDQVTWSGEGVDLTATVVDDGSSDMTIEWTADPADDVVITGGDTATPTVTMTKLPYSEARITNAGFEDPVMTDGASSWTVSAGWSGSGCGSLNPGLEGTEWAAFGGEAPEGENVLFINNGGVASTELSETIQADATYTLNVDVGLNAEFGANARYKVQLLAGAGDDAAVVAQDDNSRTIALGTFETSTVVFTCDPIEDANKVGLPLKISLLCTSTDVPSSDVEFDNVVLTADPAFPALTGVSTITMTVAVSDITNPTPDTDSITIDVYDDACAAARDGLDLSSETDLIVDCITDSIDLSELAKMWLTDNSLATAIASAKVPVGYEETFDGDGSTGLDGVGPWGAKSEFLLTDGTVLGGGSNGALAGAALLPFDPVPGKVYEMSMDLYHTGNDPSVIANLKYLGMGFATLGMGDYSKQVTGYRFPQNGGIAFMHYGQGGAIDMYEGPNAYTDGVKNATIPTTGVYAGQTWVNLKIVLDTAGDGSSCTADFMIDDVSISSGPFQIDVPVADINYAGIGSYGTRNGDSPVGSMIDNFKLVEVVTDETLPTVDAGDNWVSWSGNTIALDASVVNNAATSLTYMWTTDADGVVFDPAIDPADPNTCNVLSPTVTITKEAGNPTDVVLTLAVNNVDSGKSDVVDTVTVKLYDDACLAAIGEGVATIDVTDFDGDCITNLADVAEVAKQWLVDYQLTESTDKL